MANSIVNLAKGTSIYGIYRNSADDITKELKVFFDGRTAKSKDVIKPTQDQNNDGVIGVNQDTAREVSVVLREPHLSDNELNRQQAEKLYYSSIFPKVEENFICRNNGNYHEVPINGIIETLDTKMSIDKVLNFLCNDPDFIPQIIEKGNALEFTKVIDLLLNTIKNTGISEVESQQAFLVLDRLYKKLPEVAHIKPSLYGKMHALFSLVLNDNKQGVMHTLTEAMTSEYNKKYFNLYINNDDAIENDYLNLITKIYASLTESQEIGDRLFESLFTFLGANNLREINITSAKALYLASSISDIIYTFDDDHQAIFIEYFIDRKIDGNKFDDILVQTLKQNGLLEKHHVVINNKKDISKIPQYNIIDYLAHQDQDILKSNTIDNEWLLETSTSNRKQHLLAMIDKLDIYNCHSLANYLSSTDDMVFQEVIASKSTQVYERMIDLLITKLQSTTTLSDEDSNKITELLKQLYITLPSLSAQSQSLCSKIYKAFNLLIPQSINLIMSILHQATKRNPDFYFPLSVIETKYIISDFLDLIAKIYGTPTEYYRLLYESLEYITINVSNDSSKCKTVFFTEKLYEIVANLPDKEKQSIVIKSLLDSLTFSINVKYYLYCMFYDAGINLPDCKFQPLDQLAMKNTKKQIALIKTHNPYFFNEE
jgi:hypothetical protein